MKRSGTKTQVTQSIDTWSFGCVLSVAATWLVLGFQGVLQYTKLRQLATSNQQNNRKATDWFHDGERVLPEIQAWHKYLKAHVRTSDTATPLILELVETHMLQTRPNERFKSDQLCDELSKCISTAEIYHKSTGFEDADSVKRALLVVDELADLPSDKINWGHNATVKNQLYIDITQDGAAPSTLHVPPAPTEQESNRAGKQARLQRIPFAKTPHRKEILENEMSSRMFWKGVDEDAQVSVGSPKYDGDMTNSPVDNLPSEELSQLGNERPPPRVRDVAKDFQVGSTTHSRHPKSESSSYQQADVPSIKVPSPWRSSQEIQTTDRTIESCHHPPSVVHHEYGDSSKRNSSDLAITQDSQSAGPQFVNGTVVPVFSNARENATVSSLSDDASVNNPPIVLSPQMEPRRIDQNGIVDAPYPLPSIPENQTIDWGNGLTRSGNDDITVTALHEEKGKGPVLTQNPEDGPQPPNVTALTNPPPHPYELEWDVCKVRKELESGMPKSYMAKTVAMVFRREPKDEEYAMHIHHRDIVGKKEIPSPNSYSNNSKIFVVDNGSSMYQHWPICRFVTQTLLMKVAGLDKDGVDIRFTINGNRLNKDGLRRTSGLSDLNTVLNSARPSQSNENRAREATDMRRVLHDIFVGHRNKGPEKMTTVIVLTDGVWEGSSLDLVKSTIVDFVRRLEKDKRDFGPRHFTIGFVNFGDGKEEREKLQYLDDKLCQENGLK